MELTKEELEIKVAFLLEQNNRLSEELLNVQIRSGAIRLESNEPAAAVVDEGTAQPVGNEE